NEPGKEPSTKLMLPNPSTAEFVFKFALLPRVMAELEGSVEVKVMLPEPTDFNWALATTVIAPGTVTESDPLLAVILLRLIPPVVRVRLNEPASVPNTPVEVMEFWDIEAEPAVLLKVAVVPARIEPAPVTERLPVEAVKAVALFDWMVPLLVTVGTVMFTVEPVLLKVPALLKVVPVRFTDEAAVSDAP